jgi:leucyl/phenylalanyl-tRNA--protein transferase
VPVYLLNEDLVFPPPELATEEGLLAVGGDVSPERLMLAYGRGIFPWPMRGMPLLWFSPDPRFILPLEDVHLSRSLRRSVRRERFSVTFDRAFARVVRACARSPRPGQDGTWITDDLRRGYVALHERGIAHSAEAWRGDELVGGLYGVSLGAAFFGESMFSSLPDASKVAFVALLGQLARWEFALVDCQVYTDHLARFGAVEVPRAQFLTDLETALARPTRPGPWHLEISVSDAVEALSASDGARRATR